MCPNERCNRINEDIGLFLIKGTARGRSLREGRPIIGLLRPNVFTLDFEGPIPSKLKAKALERRRIDFLRSIIKTKVNKGEI